MIIFFQDLKEEVQQEIIEELKKKLAPEISEAVEAGINRETAEVEITDYHINVHNFGIEVDY